MKIFVVTDLHGQRSALLGVNRHLKANRYDAAFMLGDLCDQHDPKALNYARDFIDLLAAHRLPLYVVHGNQESSSVKLLFQQRGVSVHFNQRSLGEYEVVGVGFGDAFPVDPSFASGKILLTHEPPRAATIRTMKAKGVLPNAPIIHLAGHLHKLARAHQLGRTVLAQIPAAVDMRAAELELPSCQVKFIKLS